MVFRLLVSTPNDSSHPYKLFVFYFAYKQTKISIPQFIKIQFSTKFEFKFLKFDFLDNLLDNVDLLKTLQLNREDVIFLEQRRRFISGIEQSGWDRKKWVTKKKGKSNISQFFLCSKHWTFWLEIKSINFNLKMKIQFTV